MGRILEKLRSVFGKEQKQQEQISMQCGRLSCSTQKLDYYGHCPPIWFSMKVGVVAALLVLTCGGGGYQYIVFSPAASAAVVTEAETGFLFLPPAFRFLKYCKITEQSCIERNMLEFWSDLKRYTTWKRNYPASSLWWTTKHPKLADWLDSEYFRLQEQFAE